MSSGQIDSGKRKMLIGATVGTFGIGAGFVAVPFLSSMSPSEKAKAAGAPVEVDLSKIAMGQKISVIYRGKPIWIMRRGKEALANIKALSARVLDSESNGSKQPDYCKNEMRAVEGKEEFFVVNSLCTHLGCIPSYRPEVGPKEFDANWKGGLHCPCHGSLYDLAGRVYPGVPAPKNLEIPPYAFLEGNKLIIGLDPSEIKGAA